MTDEKKEVYERQITRKNHYVPEWYQKGFLLGKPKYWYHDMRPDVVQVPGKASYTRRSLYDAAPKSCFYEEDLYTTVFGSKVSDDIERFLFGRIDITGAKAVRAFIDGRLEEVHPAFQDFFEYMDAQLLRTPRGLDWIKSRYGELKQVQLMTEMQSLRSMHCTMWAESVREIVSAAESELKFIVSDCPVTLYNPACPPESKECSYPNDPKVEWLGTQTIFPLDSNHCLILTHVDYAKEPASTLLTTSRVNARFDGGTLARTDAFIRTRKLVREEVSAINYLLKHRARRYVAAHQKEWLSPEVEFRGEWKDIAQVLLPKDKLWQFGGEVYVGYADGSSAYYDQYGRTSKAHEALRKPPRKSRVKPNDGCGCGSGKKFKQCCLGVPDAERPSWLVYSARERNLIFCAVVEEILELDKEATWDTVRGTLTDEQVVAIHREFTLLWPMGTDPAEILPRPLKNGTRALYLGLSDPRTTDVLVTSWLAYFDEIILVHPFLNASRVKPEFSPTVNPSKYKLQTLKNVFLLLRLEPFIRRGVIHLIPNPADFNLDFGQSMLEMAEARAAKWKPSDEDFRRFELLQRDDLHRQIMCLPEEAIRSLLKRSFAGEEEEIEKALAALKQEQEADVLALTHPLPPGGQLVMATALGLESAIFIATLTGSFPYSESFSQIEQFNQHARKIGIGGDSDWRTVSEKLCPVELPLEIIVQKQLRAKDEGRFSSFRIALRTIVNELNSGVRAQPMSQLLKKLDVALERNQAEWKSYGPPPNGFGRISLFIPQGGYSRHEVQRLLVKYGGADMARPLPFVARIEVEVDSFA